MRAVVVFICVFAWAMAASAVAANEVKLKTIASVDARYPNSQQSSQRHNGYSEGFIKPALQFANLGPVQFKVFGKAFYQRDELSLSFNNINKYSLGLILATRIGRDWHLSFEAHYDWRMQLSPRRLTEGWVYELKYFVLKSKPTQGFAPFGLLPHRAVFKSFGTLKYPGSLTKGNTNLVVDVGAEYARAFRFPSLKWQVAPFAFVILGWDSDRNNFNNKVIPSVGLKMRYPIKGGEVVWGARYEADYRWVANTWHLGPRVFFRWFKSF